LLWKDQCAGDTHTTVNQAEAEDLASRALTQLLKCPKARRSEHAYVTRVIINGVLDGLRIRRKIRANEWQPPHRVRGPASEEVEYFDSLPGPDGLAHKTQLAFDSQTALEHLDDLPQAERVVIQLHFGLHSDKSFTISQISRKLARSERWVESRLATGIRHLREQMLVSVPLGT
jgi:RNA polymerase sigma factor (sigma-70 family)